MATYRTRWGADTVEIRANFNESSCVIEGMDQRQVAEFQHRPDKAMRHAIELLARDDGRDLDECADEIDAAVAKMAEIED